jgi:hypothetical protein
MRITARQESVMLSILYVSTAVQPFDEQELLDLVQSSQRNNERRSVTGVLFHANGGFMQVIEGPNIVVHHLFEAIRRDPRHRGVTPLCQRLIETREFHGWWMAFNNVPSAALAAMAAPPAPAAPHAYIDLSWRSPLPLGSGAASRHLASFARGASLPAVDQGAGAASGVDADLLV